MQLSRLQKILITLVITVVSLVFISTQLSKFALDVTLSHWDQGAEGYAKASQAHKESGNPIAIMFYTDDCENCEYLREEVLSKPEVAALFHDLHPVKIDPEKGHLEAKLAKAYDISGYPSFYLINEESGKIEEIPKTMVTPKKFIEQLHEAKIQVNLSNS